ncbi:hypothetical protein PCANC_10230 [Puccinia coronata f. sp. avenae]|uniref:Uncharacterized protein n=1 Tax=Puccinia coronata f. sp. avenae TaxID=200324 RepID=A0A2N5VEL4_9BASI|nr:hypothetical protein PCANC_10230 [Puccinia coronata f. sp. avenae]
MPSARTKRSGEPLEQPPARQKQSRKASTSGHQHHTRAQTTRELSQEESGPSLPATKKKPSASQKSRQPVPGPSSQPAAKSSKSQPGSSRPVAQNKQPSGTRQSRAQPRPRTRSPSPVRTRTAPSPPPALQFSPEARGRSSESYRRLAASPVTTTYNPFAVSQNRADRASRLDLPMSFEDRFEWPDSEDALTGEVRMHHTVVLQSVVLDAFEAVLRRLRDHWFENLSFDEAEEEDRRDIVHLIWDEFRRVYELSFPACLP